MFDLHLDAWCAIFDGVLEFNKPAARPELVSVQIAGDG